jgi:hypothetical protein
MNRIILLLLSGLFFNGCLACGQNLSDSIQIKKKFGTVFIQNKKKMTSKQLLEVTKRNLEAYNEMKIAKSNSTISSVFGFIGGMMVGFSLGTAIAGEKPNWAVAGIGVGFITVSIPFSISYNKHAKRAIRIYNKELR